MDVYMPFLIWGGLFVVTVIAEIASQQLISIWFAAGSLAAFLSACFNAPIVVQIFLFVLVSVLLLLCTRPLAKKFLSFGIKNTNMQEIGRIATVIQPIDPVKNTGRVRLDGVDWLAVSQDGTPISAQSSVQIEAVDGCKLIVTPLKDSVAVAAART